jgi:hypothetical protein
VSTTKATDRELAEGCREALEARGMGDGDEEAPAPPAARLATAEADRRELASRLDDVLGTLEAFVEYYEIPRNHPDAALIAGEVLASRALLRRLGLDRAGKRAS